MQPDGYWPCLERMTPSFVAAVFRVHHQNFDRIHKITVRPERWLSVEVECEIALWWNEKRPVLRPDRPEDAMETKHIVTRKARRQKGR